MIAYLITSSLGFQSMGSQPAGCQRISTWHTSQLAALYNWKAPFKQSNKESWESDINLTNKQTLEKGNM